MFRSVFRKITVKLFGAIATLNVKSPLFDRAFLALYSAYKKYIEAGPINRLQDFVVPGTVVFDVGANVGFFSRRFAEWVGDGEVIAIEPEDRNYEMLISMLQREHLTDRVRALKAVAAAAPGRMLLEVNPLHPADHKISRSDEGVAVNALALDDLVQASDKVSLIKIDVQGAEMLVLKGAASMLKKNHPALFVELHEEGLKEFGTSVSAILEHLTQVGYEPYWLERTGPHRRTTPSEIREEVARMGYVDVLFLKIADYQRAS